MLFSLLLFPGKHPACTELRNRTCPGAEHLCFERGRKLTALLGALVVADQGLLVGSAEESCPVDGAVVAELAVLGDVDVAGADLPQGLELQRGDALLLQDQQRDSAESGEQGGGEMGSSGPEREGRGMKGVGEDKRESIEEKKNVFFVFSFFQHSKIASIKLLFCS